MKAGLAQAIRETRAREAELMLPLNDDAPAPAGQWSAKDNLAHLAAWRDHAAQELTSTRTGEALPRLVEGFDEQNAVIHEATKDLPATAVADAVAGVASS